MSGWKAPVREVCPRCDAPVYFNESKLGAGKKWHTGCFKCLTCNKMLESTTLAEHDGKLYCKACHGKQFGPKGYGYGQGAGVLSMDAGRGKQAPSMKPTGAAIGGATVEGGCPRCGKRVYMAERQLAIGKEWHKSCFNCKQCKKSLDSTSVNDKDGEIYCKGCYGRLFGPKGVGYGLGAGALST